MAELAHKMEDLLDMIRKGEHIIDGHAISLILEAIDELVWRDGVCDQAKHILVEIMQWTDTRLTAAQDCVFFSRGKK